MSKLENEDQYLPDRPIEEVSQDRFKRTPFANRIADSIGTRTDTSGLVIGLYGAWGDGKTSALNLMEQKLKQYDDVIVTKFNPWFFQSESILIEAFFDHLAKEVGSVLETDGQDFVNSIRKYGSLLSIVGSSISVGGVSINFDAVTKAAKAFSKNSTPLELRDRISDILNRSGKRIVVLIDDIDRLDKEEIHQIFKLVKLSGNFENTTYVLAFDKDMVAAALSEKYASTSNGGSGAQFLEKIIQVPLHLPAVERQLLHRTFYQDLDAVLKSCKVELEKSDAYGFTKEFPTSIGHALRTPRQITRYINAIAFAVPILKDEVNLRDLLLVEGLRVFYPSVYGAIRDNADLLLHDYGIQDRGKKAGELVKSIIEKLKTPEEQEGIKGLISELFPRSGTSAYGDGWDAQWTNTKRICTDAYFQRYFSYTIPFDDISDVSFQSFIKEIAEISGNTKICEHVRTYAEKESMKALIPKMRQYEDTMGITAAKKLAIGISANADLLPLNVDPFFSPSAQAIYFATKILSRSTKSSRDKFAHELLQTAQPILFAVQCFLHFRHGEKTPETDRMISEKAEDDAGKKLAKEVRAEFEKKPLYTGQREGVIQALWLWNLYGKKGEIQNCLAKRLDTHPDEVAEFLSVFVGTAYGGDGPPHMSNFDQQSYGELVKVVDPQKVIDAVQKSKYKDKLAVVESRRGDLDEYQLITNQFAAVHAAQPKVTVSQESAPSDSAPTDS